MQQKNHQRLSYRIAFILSIGMTMMMLMMVGAGIFFTYGLINVKIEEKIQEVSDNVVAALRDPVWNLDYDQIDTILSSALRDSDIEMMTLRDELGKNYTQKEASYNPGQEYSVLSKVVMRSDGTVERPIGQLQVFYSKGTLKQSLQTATIVALSLSGLLCAALVFFIFITTKRALKPVENLSEYILKYDQLDENWVPPASTAHEITQLLRALNYMRATNASYVRTMRQQMADLAVEKSKAEKASAAKTEFLSNMSHEMRTPMHAIINYAQMGGDALESGQNQEKIPKYFTNIQKSASRLLRLINNLLDLAKMEAGKLSMSSKEGDILACIHSVMDELHVLFLSKQLKESLIVNTQRTHLSFDHELMTQVFVNILSNAIKFAPENSPVIITVYDAPYVFHQEAVDALHISVEDRGVGIPVDEMESIFEKFVQSSQTKTGAGGTGLGLAICKNIMQAHDGDIQVGNLPEGGACFVISLPYQQRNQAAVL